MFLVLASREPKPIILYLPFIPTVKHWQANQVAMQPELRPGLRRVFQHGKTIKADGHVFWHPRSFLQQLAF